MINNKEEHFSSEEGKWISKIADQIKKRLDFGDYMTKEIFDAIKEDITDLLQVKARKSNEKGEKIDWLLILNLSVFMFDSLELSILKGQIKKTQETINEWMQ